MYKTIVGREGVRVYEAQEGVRVYEAHEVK
jgi:nitrous oxidase accessory protein NosD